MRLGIVGLGRMGANVGRHAVEKGHEVVGYDASGAVAAQLAAEGLKPAASIEDLVGKLTTPRTVLIYVPHGDPTEAVCRALRPALAPGDIVADTGNSHWADSQRRHVFFAETGVRFLDVGTSGGVSGARRGACFMVGGDRAAFDAIAPLLRDLAVDDSAVLFAGPSGSGHFAKLVHNAIEFGMVQAIGEGVEMLARSGLGLDLPALLENWMHGSVIRSWLVELMGNALREHGAEMPELSTYVEDTSEVKWVLDWALAQDIPTPVVSASQTALMQSRDLTSVASKAVALLRNQFGGHPVRRASGAERR